MVSQVDFAVAVGLFLTFIAILVLYTLSYITSYSSVVSTSELRTVAYNILSYMLNNKGIPTNWEAINGTPLKIGLITDLYRMPIVITETNGTDRTNITINVTVSLDNNCDNKAWNTTVRLYDVNNAEIVSSLHNQTICSSSYVNKTDLTFNLTLAPNQKKTFFLYFSPDRNVSAPTYSLPFPIDASNYTAQVFPEEKLSAISVSKVRAFANLTYEDVTRTFGTQYHINLELTEK